MQSKGSGHPAGRMRAPAANGIDEGRGGAYDAREQGKQDGTMEDEGNGRGRRGAGGGEAGGRLSR